MTILNEIGLAVADLRTYYEDTHGCNIGFETGCVAHDACPYGARVRGIYDYVRRVNAPVRPKNGGSRE